MILKLSERSELILKKKSLKCINARIEYLDCMMKKVSILVFVSRYRSDEEWHENDAKELDAEKNSRWYDEEIDRVLFDLVED